MRKYQVIVGNLGTVYEGKSFSLAKKIYFEYLVDSVSGYGRVADEPVYLCQDGEPIYEHIPHNEEEE